MSSQLHHLLNLSQCEQRSDTWFKTRGNYLTSSDVASVLGLNKYQSREHVLFKKCGIQDMFIGNTATLHGQQYEDEALKIYGDITGREVYGVGLITYDQCHDTTMYNDIDCGFLAGSADGISVTNDGQLNVLEVKAPYRRKIEFGKIPIHYLPQVYLNMFILGVDVGDFIEYIPRGHFGNGELKMNIVRVYKNTEWLDWALPILREFWNDVLYYREHGIETHPQYEKISKKISSRK